MSLLSKIKVQYHCKVLNDLLASNKFLEASGYISKINDFDLQFDIAKKYIPNIFKNTNSGIDNHKIIWLNSFSNMYIDIVENFLIYYFQESSQKINPTFSSYDEIVNDMLEKNNFYKKITLVEWINYSYFFQWLINNSNQENLKFIKNKQSFFSTPENLNFTNSNFTNCFFYIVDHPYAVYANIKKTNNDDIEVSKNIFLNLDKRPEIIQTKNRLFEITNLGWAVHAQSWIDDNVQNSLRGKTLNMKHFREDPFNFFSDVIMHLTQTNDQITLNYDLIENFLNSSNYTQLEDFSDQISNNEKKFINQQIENISLKLGYDL